LTCHGVVNWALVLSVVFCPASGPSSPATVTEPLSVWVIADL
jgi:hypothetical protein